MFNDDVVFVDLVQQRRMIFQFLLRKKKEIILFIKKEMTAL